MTELSGLVPESWVKLDDLEDTDNADTGGD